MKISGVLMIAEESTSWPGVSRPLHLGGLGFDLKEYGLMNDVLEFFSKDPVYRKYDMNKPTFGMMYAWSENFILVLSHDEVVYGKCSLLNKMPGDECLLILDFYWATCTLSLKITFHGGDIGQQIHRNHDQGLDWHLLDYKLIMALTTTCVIYFNFIAETRVCML